MDVKIGKHPEFLILSFRHQLTPMASPHSHARTDLHALDVWEMVSCMLAWQSGCGEDVIGVLQMLFH